MTRSAPNYPGKDQSAPRKAIVRFERDAGVGLLKVNLTDDYAPSRTFPADYCHIRSGIDGFHLLFGHRSPFSTDKVLKFHYLIDIVFPRAQFYNHLYKSLLTPYEPGKPLFIESVNQSIFANGYPFIEEMPDPSAAEEPTEPKLGSGRANMALMYIFDDEASIDLLHLDAMTLLHASQGKPIRTDKVGADSVRFIMAPNVMLYFLKLVEVAAKDLVKQTPAIDRKAS